MNFSSSLSIAQCVFVRPLLHVFWLNLCCFFGAVFGAQFGGFCVRLLSRFAYLGPSKGKRKTDRVRRGNACERNSVAFALKRASKRCLRPRQVRTEASSRAHQKQIEPQRRPFSIPPARCPVQNVGRLSSPSLGVCARSFPSATALASSVFRDMIFFAFCMRIQLFLGAF